MRHCNFFWKILRDTASKTKTAEFNNNIAYLIKMVVCLRYVNKILDAHEKFLSLLFMESSNANAIVIVL